MALDKTLRIAGIVDDSITDGPGIRTTVFVQGCPHLCPGCHNPESHDFTAGTEMDIEDIFERIQSNPLLSGVTFSGGEPLSQPRALIALGRKVKAIGLELAVYTGYTWEEVFANPDSKQAELLSLADTVIDGRFMLNQRSLNLPFKGSANQRIIDVRKSLDSDRVILETSDRWSGK